MAWGSLRYAVFCALSACAGLEEKPCDPGPYFAGPILENPRVANAGDRSLVEWRWIDDNDTGVLDHIYRGVMIDADGAVIDGTQFELDLDQRVYGLISGPDRVLVLGELAAGGRFAEIRGRDGARVGSRNDASPLFFGGALEGDRFLAFADNALVRVAMDGTFEPPIALPQSANALGVTSTVTWVLTKQDETFTGVRIARGGGLLDPAPKPISTAAYFAVSAARPSEAVVVTQSRDGVNTFYRLAPDGTVGPAIPLSLDVAPHLRPRWLAPEAGGYLLMLEDMGRNEIAGVRLTPDGVPTPPFMMFDYSTGNSLTIANQVDRNVIVYGPIARERGGAPRIEAVVVHDGNVPSAATLVETVEGETYTVDCGCQIGGHTGWLAGFIVVFAIRRRRRQSSANVMAQRRSGKKLTPHEPS